MMGKRNVAPVSKDAVVTEMLAQIPATGAVMVGYGFLCLSDPTLRQAIPASLTLETAAAIHGVNLEALLRDLCEVAQQPSDAPPDWEMQAERAKARNAVPEGVPVNAGTVLLALRSCSDPELSVNIVDLGLIYDIQIQDDCVLVEMTLRRDDPYLAEALTLCVKEAIRSLGTAQDVEVRLMWEPPWRPSRAAPVVRRILGWTDGGQ
jgi:metal-sulfur cluster biosynthetic enzyme